MRFTSKISGFKTIYRSNLSLDVGQTLGLVFSLALENTRQVVKVAAGNPTFAGYRPNLIGNTKPAHQIINEWLNPRRFRLQLLGPPASAPGNLTTPQTDGLFNLDISLLKNFSIMETVHCQFIAEAQGDQHHHFGKPDAGSGSPSFGVITRDLNPLRNVQLSFKMVF